MMSLNNNNTYSCTGITSKNKVQISSTPQTNFTASNINNIDSRYQDTVTLSSRARAGMESKGIEEADTYEHLAPSTRALYSKNTSDSAGNVASDKLSKAESDNTNFLHDALQTLAAKRTGLDKEKLKEIDTQMEEVAKNKNLSPEQKAEQLKLLQEQKDQLVKESVERNEERQQQSDLQVSNE